mmetsp:Transcript_26530/g.56995  ORF Transcript_26530/g.56995 Transcript_26530/m.56995 type:complete len:307 (+) Transcript_26530:529-1449(+)
MIVGADANVSQIVEGIDIKYGLAPAVDAIDTNGVSQLLIEIAIVNFPVPTNVYGIEAHELLDGIGVEIPHQQIHVFGELPPSVQKVGESLDRHVGDGEELVEDNPKVLRQLLLVLHLQIFLRRRQKGSQWIVHQIELQAGRMIGIGIVIVIVIAIYTGLPVPSVPHLVERQQGGNRSLKDTPAALGVDVFGRITGQTSNHVHVVFLEKLHQIFLPRLLQDGQVAPIDDDQIFAAKGPGRADQVPKVLVEFRSSTGNVEGGDAGGVFQKLQAPGSRLGRHHFLRPKGRGFDVAVTTGLVAIQADVDL